MFQADYAPYDPTDKAGFSYETVVKRWPIILTGIVNEVYHANHELILQGQEPQGARDPVNLREEKISEGKKIVEKISHLKYKMARDHALEPIPDDGEPHVETYNSELVGLAERGKGSWFTAPWLYAECYLYRLVRSYFSGTKHWHAHDPFSTQKQDTFQQSGASIYKIATIMHEFDVEKSALESDPDKLEVLFNEMIQMCLWGNATDLSLLTNMSSSDIDKLQSVGKDAQKARKEFILKDDANAVWNHIKTFKEPQRVDFVLDNAGFELFTDFVFADFLVTYTPYVSKVIFHPKLIPWFVSDVTPSDFVESTTSLLSSSFFKSTSAESNPAKEHLETMVTRWSKYLTAGTFALSVPTTTPIGASHKLGNFWTAPWPYWDMQSRAEELWKSLSESGLVIFKGDLNYRKLTGDIKWPVATPFASAIGPLAGSFPILSLRTNKADVVVGVDQEIADKLDAKDEKWRVNGKYALVSFVPKHA